MDRKTLAITIGKQIEAARLEAGFSRKEVGERLGLSERGYGHLEAGRNLIGLEYLLQLPRILGKPVTFFLPHFVVSEAELNDLSHDPQFQVIMSTWPHLTPKHRGFVHDLAVMLREAQEYGAGED